LNTASGVGSECVSADIFIDAVVISVFILPRSLHNNWRTGEVFPNAFGKIRPRLLSGGRPLHPRKSCFPIQCLPGAVCAFWKNVSNDVHSVAEEQADDRTKNLILSFPSTDEHQVDLSFCSERFIEPSPICIHHRFKVDGAHRAVWAACFLFWLAEKFFYPRRQVLLGYPPEMVGDEIVQVCLDVRFRGCSRNSNEFSQSGLFEAETGQLLSHHFGKIELILEGSRRSIIRRLSHRREGLIDED